MNEPNFYVELPSSRGFRSREELNGDEVRSIALRCPYCGTTREKRDHTDLCPLGKLEGRRTDRTAEDHLRAVFQWLTDNGAAIRFDAELLMKLANKNVLSEAKAFLASVESTVTANAELRRADAFKNFVHRRLDAAGVPKEFPDGEHTKEGCRIGDRLDWVLDRLATRESEITAQDVIDWINKKPTASWLVTLADINQVVAEIKAAKVKQV